MAEKTKQRYSKRLKQAFAEDMRIYDQYIGREVLIVEGGLHGDVSRAVLVSHGSQLADFIDYIALDPDMVSMHSLMEELAGLKSNPDRSMELKASYSLPRRTISKSQIASILRLEDIMQGIKPEQVTWKK